MIRNMRNAFVALTVLLGTVAVSFGVETVQLQKHARPDSKSSECKTINGKPVCLQPSGFEELYPGMSLRDLHALACLSLDVESCRAFESGARYVIPVSMSLVTDRYAGKRAELCHQLRYLNGNGRLVVEPWQRAMLDAPKLKICQQEKIADVSVKLPEGSACGTVNFALKADGETIARNFQCFIVRDGGEEKTPSASSWDRREWTALNGNKRCGAGSGYFEYEFDNPDIPSVFQAEVSAQRFNGKDRAGVTDSSNDMDSMVGGGYFDRSCNSNSYPMTFSEKHTGIVRIYANGKLTKTTRLLDAPADIRGILSWFSQMRSPKGDEHSLTLDEVGSYGYLVEVTIPEEIIRASPKRLTVRLESDRTGLAVYGAKSGRYPFGPQLVASVAGRPKELVGIDSLPIACHPKVTVAEHAPSLLPDDHEFRLAWHDEFDGTSLDTSKWSYRTNFWGRRAHWFATPEDGCVEVGDGFVRLKVRKLANGQFVSPQLQTGEIMWDVPAMDNAKSFWYLGKRMKPKFLHKYGYYECRCRLQRKPGWWSAFWMQTEMQGACLDPGLAGIEQDIMESFEPGVIEVSSYHTNGYGPDYLGFHIPSEYDIPPKYDGKLNLSLDTDEFHTFGLLWEPDGYSVYVDGRLRGKNGKAVSHIPEFLLISTECKWYRRNRMTGRGAPELERAAAANDDFTVDYVRVYDMVR